MMVVIQQLLAAAAVLSLHIPQPPVPPAPPEPAVSAPAEPAPYEVPEPWASLAECESGGDWQINTGNGYFGGVQFSLRSWRWVGGDEFAPRPDLATPRHQMRVAERLLERQGWNAWPACSKKLGLR